VASTSLCGDQFVLALAAPQQIVSLSYQATDRRLSLLAGQARGYPQNRGAAEEILASGAEVVVGDAWISRRTMAMLERQGRHTIAIDLTDSLDEINRLTLAIADALERRPQGEALVTQLQARYQRLARARPERAPLAVYLQPGGGSAGAGTFVDTLMRWVGLRNLAAELGKRGWGRLDLESLVRHRPELVVTSFFEHTDDSLFSAYARHPVFRQLLATTPTLGVPDRDWICSGWFLIEAAERLAQGPAKAQP